METILIPRDKSVVVAADVTKDRFPSLIQATCDVDGIGGYKVGLALGLRGLRDAVSIVREYTNLPVIYDHQKAGNDIPAMDSEFVTVCKEAGVNAVILFPFAGPVTQIKWTKTAQDAGLVVLTGGHMTHEKFLAIEGGYIADNAPEIIYRTAAKLGVRDLELANRRIKELT